MKKVEYSLKGVRSVRTLLRRLSVKPRREERQSGLGESTCAG